LINKTSSILGLITILQLVIGLFSQIYIIKILGVGEFTDVFIASQTIPAILSTLLVTVFQSVYLPSLSIKSKFQKRWRIEQGKAHAKLMIIFGGLFVILFLSSGIVLSLIFQGFDTKQIELTKYLFIFFMISFWLNTHSHISAITLRTIDKFVLADSILLIGTVINLMFIFFFLNKERIDILGYIYVISSFIVFFSLYFLSGKPQLIFKGIFKNNKNWTMMLPLFKGNMLYKTSPIVDRYLLSHSFSGAMTIYNIASMINSAIIKVADKLIVIMYLPKIANLVKDKKIEELENLYKKLFLQTLMLTGFIGFVFFAIKPFWFDIVHFLFNVSEEQSKILWWILIIFLGLIFSSLFGTVTNNIFYSHGNAKTINSIGIINYTLFVPLKFIFFYKFGLIGLAITQTIFFCVQLMVVYYYLTKFKYLNITEEVTSFVTFK